MAVVLTLSSSSTTRIVSEPLGTTGYVSPIDNIPLSKRQFTILKHDMEKYSISTVCEKKELEWKHPLQRFKVLKIAAMLISRHW